MPKEMTVQKEYELNCEKIKNNVLREVSQKNRENLELLIEKIESLREEWYKNNPKVDPFSMEKQYPDFLMPILSTINHFIKFNTDKSKPDGFTRQCKQALKHLLNDVKKIEIKAGISDRFLSGLRAVASAFLTFVLGTVGIVLAGLSGNEKGVIEDIKSIVNDTKEAFKVFYKGTKSSPEAMKLCDDIKQGLNALEPKSQGQRNTLFPEKQRKEPAEYKKHKPSGL